MDNTPGDKLGVWRDMRLADALVLLLVTAASDLLVHKINFENIFIRERDERDGRTDGQTDRHRMTT